jgi:hypothetical protein
VGLPSATEAPMIRASTTLTRAPYATRVVSRSVWPLVILA